jgi:hypothetical protein
MDFDGGAGGEQQAGDQGFDGGGGSSGEAKIELHRPCDDASTRTQKKDAMKSLTGMMSKAVRSV